VASQTETPRDRRTAVAELAVAVVRHVYRTDASYYAAGLSYYALTAVMPTLLLLSTAAARFGEAELVQRGILRLGGVLTPRGQSFVLGTLRDVLGRPGIAAFATLVAVASAIQLFRTLNRAFELIYETERRPLIGHLHEGAVVLVVGLFGTLAVLFAAGAMSLYATTLLRLVIAPVLVFVATGAALYPIFLFVPDPDIRPAEALPGTVFAAAAWTLVGAVLGLYAANATQLALYGLLGGLLLVITWLYAAHYTVLLGAALNAVVAGRVSTEVTLSTVDG